MSMRLMMAPETMPSYFSYEEPEPEAAPAAPPPPGRTRPTWRSRIAEARRKAAEARLKLSPAAW